MRMSAVIAAATSLVAALLLSTGGVAYAASMPGTPTVAVDTTAADEVTVTWTAPNDGGAGPLSYTVSASVDTGTAPTSQTTSTTSAVFEGLTTDSTYTFSVRATNQAGLKSHSGIAPAIQATETPFPDASIGTVTVTGSPQYLHTVTAVPAGWGSGTTYHYQWSSSGGGPIVGATGQTFRIADPSLVGQQLTVTVAGSEPGYIDSAGQTATSSIITPAPMPGIAYIGGHPTAGGTWTAGTAGWPTGTNFAYQWSLDGNPTVTTPSYAVANSLVNAHRVGLSVAGRAPGYANRMVSVRSLRVQTANPLAGGLWPADLSAGSWDHDLVSDYLHSTGTAHTLQGKIATRPRATWFGGWNDPQTAASLVSGYINVVQDGNTGSLVTLTLHAIWMMDGNNENTRNKPMTSRDIAAYKAWMTAVAKAIGTSRVAIIMEPDLAELPKAMTGNLNTADPKVRASLVAWATTLLAKNRNAAIYLDAGDADWQPVSTMLPWLERAGISHARGFALGATHYSKTGGDIAWGTAMVAALNKTGVASLRNKHFVIDTADNGQGFTWQDWNRAHGGATFNNASPCASTRGPAPCASLGVPPTWQIADTKLALTATQRSQALKYVDAYLWFSRPWLPWQSGAYSPSLGRKLAASSPYA